MKTDGNQLLNMMDDQAGIKEGYAYGYIAGLSYLTCTPNNVTNGQMYAIVKKYLTQNPEVLHQQMNYLVIDALNKAFPCKQDTSAKSKKAI
jgi:hypothetical protein